MKVQIEFSEMENITKDINDKNKIIVLEAYKNCVMQVYSKLEKGYIPDGTDLNVIGIENYLEDGFYEILISIRTLEKFLPLFKKIFPEELFIFKYGYDKYEINVMNLLKRANLNLKKATDKFSIELEEGKNNYSLYIDYKKIEYLLN